MLSCRPLKDASVKSYERFVVGLTEADASMHMDNDPTGPDLCSMRSINAIL